MYKNHERALEALARRGRRRSLAAFSGIDFSSNDYLGLASSRELKEAARSAIARDVPIGSGGSRLLRGNHREHEALEAEAAAFFGAESALFFGGGFLANLALFSTLPQRGDLVVHDALIHASVHDGLRMGKAERAEARHNDPQAFEDAIADWRTAGGTGTPWIAVESLYSMDGDCAPLDQLLEVARRHDGVLVIDEAHATGVLGPMGRGLGAHLEGQPNVVALHTCGKALGAMGALVTGPQVLCDYLVNRSRPFIYATAPSPLVAAIVRAALLICRFDSARRDKLASLVAFTGKQLAESCGLSASGTQIQPVVVGVDERATRLAAAMQARGFDIRAVRPPTVPEGTARLRLSLTLNVDEAQVASMIAALAEELKRLDA
ncbi:MAG: 8-amino-7-oxononanoate synthase [Hyphomicrobium sp.]